MARVALRSLATVQDTTQPGGATSANASVNVYATGGTTPVTVYSAATGAGTLTPPFLTDALGQLPGFVNDGQTLDYGVTTAAGRVFTQSGIANPSQVNVPGSAGQPQEVSSGGHNDTPIAAATATATVIKASSGRLARVEVIATGTNPMSIYDNASAASGTIIGQLPASPPVGTVYSFEMPASNGITVGGNAANPGVLISWT